MMNTHIHTWETSLCSLSRCSENALCIMSNMHTHTHIHIHIYIPGRHRCAVCPAARRTPCASYPASWTSKRSAFQRKPRLGPACMYVCMFVCMYARVCLGPACACMHVCFYVYMYICVCVPWTCMCMHACMYVHTYVCMCVSRTCICIYVCMYVCMYVCLIVCN